MTQVPYLVGHYLDYCEYVDNKKNSTKLIRETNMPLNVEKMLEIVNRNNPKKRLVQTETIEPIPL